MSELRHAGRNRRFKVDEACRIKAIRAIVSAADYASPLPKRAHFSINLREKHAVPGVLLCSC